MINQRMLQEFEGTKCIDSSSDQIFLYLCNISSIAKRKLAAQAAETRAHTALTKPDAEATERVLHKELSRVVEMGTKEMDEIMPEPIVTLPQQMYARNFSAIKLLNYFCRFCFALSIWLILISFSVMGQS